MRTDGRMDGKFEIKTKVPNRTTLMTELQKNSQKSLKLYIELINHRVCIYNMFDQKCFNIFDLIFNLYVNIFIAVASHYKHKLVFR